uniref:Caspase-8 n=1 Tax=Magallana gigas TaxID=29159 RepID=A0A8W8LAS0_MAGGI
MNDIETDNTIWTDAVSEKGYDYGEFLVCVDSGLDTSDVDNLKFLLRGVLPDSKIQRAERGLDLFTELQNAGVIDIDNADLELLEECLYRIHRKDLLKKMARDTNLVEQRLKRLQADLQKKKISYMNSAKFLSPFRVLLFEIGEDIDDEEFKSVMFTLTSVVPKGQLSKMKSIFDLFLFLEKKDEMSHTKVDVLLKVLKVIDRADLIPKVNKYISLQAKENNYSQNSQPTLMEVEPPQVPPTGAQNHPPPQALGAGGGIRLASHAPLPQGILIRLADVIAKCPNWKDISPFLGLEDSSITAIINDDHLIVSLRILKMLEYWQMNVMQNDETCRVTMIGVLQKFRITEGLQILRETVEEDDHIPDPTPTNLQSMYRPPVGDIPEPIRHPAPEPLPAIQSLRPITSTSEIETQTSMMILPNSSQPVRDENEENLSVSNTEARVQPVEREPQPSENNYVQSERRTRDDRVDETLAVAMRRTHLDDEMDLPSYRMDRQPRGIAVIINNMKFFKVANDHESKEMPDRTGTDLDADKLTYIFQKLGFLVRRYDNLEDVAMYRRLVDVSLEDHKLTGIFRSRKCTGLAGKPKLFFIQACQGREKQMGIDIEMDSDIEADNGRNSEMIPDEADFVLGCATVPGYVSYRSRSQGSWFVNKLVEMLDKFAYRYDLLSILVKVNEEVGRANARLEGGVFKQIPAPLVTLRKKLFFK